jgi:hypothetical protein
MSTRSSVSELVEKGFLQPMKRGRPPIYSNAEEKREAYRAQQRICVKRHAERVKEALLLMKQSLDQP